MTDYIVLAYKKIDSKNFIVVADHPSPLPCIDIMQFDNDEAACALVDKIHAEIEDGTSQYIYASRHYEGY